MIIPYIYIKYVLYTALFVGLPVLTLILLKIFQRWTMGKCTSLVCLSGKTAIITGATSGIGYETALLLASRGCRVIIADKDCALRAKNKITQITDNNNVVAKYLDLSSLKSVREFAKDINETEERLDILINNACAETVGNKHTEDRLHETMQMNHFGPFLLTHLLADLMKKSAPSRIIFVSSISAFFSNLSIENLNYPANHPLSSFRTALIYGNSKLCNIISANGFAERLEDYGVTCNSLHPGWVSEKMPKNVEEWTGLDGLEYIFLSPISYMYAKTAREGAQTTLHLAMSKSVQGVTGKHFWDCITFPLPPGARNDKFCKDIWEESESFVKLDEKEKLMKISLKSNVTLSENNVEKEENEKNSRTDENQEISKKVLYYDISNRKKENHITEADKVENGVQSVCDEETLSQITNDEDENTENIDTDDESDLECNGIEKSLDDAEKHNGFLQFGKSKNTENFLNNNESSAYNKSKDRS